VAESVPSPSPLSFAQMLRRFRRAAGLTQEQLAERADLSTRAVSDLERGENHAPRRHTLDALADALQLSPEDRAELDQAVKRAHAAPPDHREAASPAHGPRAPGLDTLPAPLTTFVGRAHEVAAIGARLRDPETRLLTLIGPGGVGKTRLAIRVTEDARAAFANGVAFVSLAPVSDPTIVLLTIARALGVPEAPGQPIGAALADALRGRDLLLVLDNLEHLPAAAPLVADLLAAAAPVTALVTSRAPLRVRGERLHDVAPLAVPAPPFPSLDALARYEAVRLFMERAGKVARDVALTHETAPVVAEICRRLDGLPLAIELAAARARVLSPHDLLARLPDVLAHATSAARDLPERQRTLRATLAWSYALLDADERALFARLSVFVGGATLEAIEAVCSPTGDGSFDVLEGVGALLDQSLLRRVEGAEGERRWGMLETIRAYAQEILAVGGNEQRAAEAHARYFLALAEDASRAFGRPGHEAWFDRLEREHGNLRAALGWLLERGDAVGALRLAGHLWRFWYARGHLTEGRRWAGRTLAASADDARADTAAAALRASVLIGAGTLATNQGDMADAIALYDEALALYEATGDRASRVSTLNGLGWMLFEQGDYARAATILEEALAEADDLRQAGEAAEALLNLGHIALAHGDHAHASQRYETALGRYQALGNRRGESYGLLNLGWVRVAQRTDREAVAFLRDALMIMQSLGDVGGHASCLEGLAVAAFSGAPDQARVAVVICAAAATARAGIGAAPSEVAQPQVEAALARARAALGADSYVAAWGEGQAIDLEQATALAAAT